MTKSSETTDDKNSNLVQTTIKESFEKQKATSWQTVPENQASKKRKVDTALSPTTRGNNRNRYEMLSTINSGDEAAHRLKTDKTPPIFLYGVENFQDMREMIESVINKDEYTYKTVRGKQTIINVKTTHDYKKVWDKIREANLIHHTFPSKEDKNYRIVLKGIHPTDLDEEVLKEELAAKDHIVKKITNMKSRKTGKALPAYFVNLQVKENNKDVYTVKYLNNVRITIEPVKNFQKQEERLVQCHRCQKFGHSKNYCFHPPRCVQCGQDHLTAECKKLADTPATCALCLENHPANYSGCKVRKEILQRRQTATKKSKHQQEKFAHTHTYTMKNEDFPALTEVTTCRIGNAANEPGTWKSSRSLIDNLNKVTTQNETTANVNKLEEKLNTLLEKLSSMMDLLTLVVTKLCK